MVPKSQLRPWQPRRVCRLHGRCEGSYFKKVDESKGKLTMWVCWRAESICMITRLMEFLKVSFPNIFLCLAGLSSVARIRQICSVTSLDTWTLGNMTPFSVLEEAQPALTFPEQRMGVAGGRRIPDGCDGQAFFAPDISLWFQGLWFRIWSLKSH